jgi:hypothetical protein
MKSAINDHRKLRKTVCFFMFWEAAKISTTDFRAEDESARDTDDSIRKRLIM